MTNPISAVIIGVSDYRAADPSGRSDLPGARNDARRWRIYCEGALGLGPEQLRVHADTEGDLGTDRASLVASLRWLAAELGSGRAESGLVTFSGHGLTTEHVAGGGTDEGLSLALAPSDLSAAHEGAMSFVQVEEILHRALEASLREQGEVSHQNLSARATALLQDITFCVDACYAEDDRPGGAGRGLGPRRKAAPVKVFGRLLLASQLWQTAWEVRVAGEWHGAFTYALTSVLEQWARGSDDGTAVRYAQAAYGDLAFRTRTLVHVLGFEDQDPVLLGTAHNLALLPFLRPGLEVQRGWTSAQPNGARRREEFSAGQGDAVVVLEFKVGAGRLAMAVLTGAATVPAQWSEDFASSFEYWAWDEAVALGFDTSNPPTIDLLVSVFDAWSNVPGSLLDDYLAMDEVWSAASSYDFQAATASMPGSTNSNGVYTSTATHYPGYPGWAVQFAWVTSTGAFHGCWSYLKTDNNPPPQDAPGIVVSAGNGPNPTDGTDFSGTIADDYQQWSFCSFS